MRISAAPAVATAHQFARINEAARQCRCAFGQHIGELRGHCAAQRNYLINLRPGGLLYFAQQLVEPSLPRIEKQIEVLLVHYDSAASSPVLQFSDCLAGMYQEPIAIASINQRDTHDFD